MHFSPGLNLSLVCETRGTFEFCYFFVDPPLYFKLSNGYLDVNVNIRFVQYNAFMDAF